MPSPRLPCNVVFENKFSRDSEVRGQLYFGLEIYLSNPSPLGTNPSIASSCRKHYNTVVKIMFFEASLAGSQLCHLPVL